MIAVLKQIDMKKILWILSTIIVLTACGGDGVDNSIKLTVLKKSIVLFHNDKVNIGAATTGNTQIAYSSSDEMIASVSLNGDVKGGLIGNAKITVSDGVNTEICNVEVKQKYEYLKEPYLKFGVNRSELLNSVKDRYMFEGGGGSAVYEVQDGIFKYKRIYLFRDDKYYAVETQYDSNSSVLMETIGAIAERYPVKGSVGSSIFYESTKNNFLIRLSSTGISNIPLNNITYVLYTTDEINK